LIKNKAPPLGIELGSKGRLKVGSVFVWYARP